MGGLVFSDAVSDCRASYALKNLMFCRLMLLSLMAEIDAL